MEEKSIYQKDYTISAIRFLAMISIVLCHFLQAYGNELAWWFNVGVQVFLCMSGFLYGKKRISDNKAFYYHIFQRILPMYFIYLLIVIWPLMMAPGSGYGLKTIAHLFTITGVSTGLGHLWFIQQILICYLLTPLIQKFFIKFNMRGVLVLIIMVEFVSKIYLPSMRGPCINCYILGYVMGRVISSQEGNKNNRISRKLLTLFIIIAILLNSIQITMDYILCIKNNGASEILYFTMKEYAHVFLGVSIFGVMYTALRIRIKNSIIIKFLDKTDQYSYAIYLTHHIYILGPLSLVSGFNVSRILFIILIILISAMALLWLTNILRRILEPIFLRIVLGTIKMIENKN